MLEITIPATELWDEVNQEFKSTEERTLRLEHSLVSLSKWESRWCKPFFSKEPKNREETLDYIRCMNLTPGMNNDLYNYLTNDNLEQINKYIEAPMTATWFAEDKNKPGSREQVTSELIYYWMIALNIPPEYQYWHLNRLMTLIKVCNIKNQPPKKRSRREIMSRNAALNAARRKQFNTKG